MNHELELKAPAAGTVLFKLTMIGVVLLGCVYGFLALFNAAMSVMK